MAYCKSCGAYIPDGQSTCLACGFDETAGQREAAATAAQPAAGSGQRKTGQFDSDFLREQLEQQRRRQQENSRKWAETEYAQRRKGREEQARDFQSASAAPPGRQAGASARGDSGTELDASRLFSALSYFSVLFVLPYLFRGEDRFALFHARQGLTLFLAGVLGDIAGTMFGIGWLVAIARVYLIYKGVSNALRGKREALPYIGGLLQ